MCDTYTSTGATIYGIVNRLITCGDRAIQGNDGSRGKVGFAYQDRRRRRRSKKHSYIYTAFATLHKTNHTKPTKNGTDPWAPLFAPKITSNSFDNPSSKSISVSRN